MGYKSGMTEVKDSPSMICPVGLAGVMVQHLGGTTVTLGGEDVEWGKGIMLRPGDPPLAIPGGVGAPVALNSTAGNLVLYGVTQSDAAQVAYLKHDLLTG